MSVRGTHDRPLTREIINKNYDFTYLIKDYGDYRTISKITSDKYTGEVVAVVDRVNEYIFWESPLKDQR